MSVGGATHLRWAVVAVAVAVCLAGATALPPPPDLDLSPGGLPLNVGCPSNTKELLRVCLCPAATPVCRGSRCLTGYNALSKAPAHSFRKVPAGVAVPLLFLFLAAVG